MKRLFIILGIGAIALWVVGSFHEGIGGLFFRNPTSPQTVQGTQSTFPPPLADVQRALQEAGFDPGPIDGRMGRRTRSALKAFQSARRLKASGEVDRKTWQTLQGPTATQVASPPSIAERPKPTSAVSVAEDEPIPSHELQATRATSADVSSPATKEEMRAAIMEYRLRSPDRIKKVQRALEQAGFDPGPIDGEFGPRTDQALRAFQKAQGLEPDGIVGVKTWTALSEYLEPGSLHAQEHAALQD